MSWCIALHTKQNTQDTHPPPPQSCLSPHTNDECLLRRQEKLGSKIQCGAKISEKLRTTSLIIGTTGFLYVRLATNRAVAKVLATNGGWGHMLCMMTHDTLAPAPTHKAPHRVECLEVEDAQLILLSLPLSVKLEAGRHICSYRGARFCFKEGSIVLTCRYIDTT